MAADGYRQLSFFERVALCALLLPVLGVLSGARADVPPYNFEEALNQSCPGQTGTLVCDNWSPSGETVCVAKQYKQVHSNLFVCKGTKDWCWCLPDYDKDKQQVLKVCTSLFECQWKETAGVGSCVIGPLVAGAQNPTTAPVWYTWCYEEEPLPVP